MESHAINLILEAKVWVLVLCIGSKLADAESYVDIGCGGRQGSHGSGNSQLRIAVSEKTLCD